MKDLFGKAILDFQTHNKPEDLITETSISEEDEMSVAYLFRSYSEMPSLEQKALELATNCYFTTTALNRDIIEQSDNT